MSQFTYRLQNKLEQSATLGLIVLKADETIELDFRKLFSNDVAIHTSRIQSDAEVTADALIRMKDRLAQSASLFPDAAQFDCVGYACTSGTSVIGQSEVATRINQACNTKYVTDPMSALIAACSDNGAKRLAILSPYVEEVSNALRNVLVKNEIQTPVFGSFNEADEASVVRIDDKSIFNAAISLARSSDIDALFISCTNLRTLSVIEKIKHEIGKPVLTSNQVLAWHMAKLAGIESEIKQL